MTSRLRMFGFDLGGPLLGVGSAHKGGRISRKRRYARGAARWPGLKLSSGFAIGTGSRRRRRKGGKR